MSRLLALQRADHPRVRFHEFSGEALETLRCFGSEVASALGIDLYSTELEFFVVAPTSSFGGLKEVKVEDGSDLEALQDEDVVIVREKPMKPLTEAVISELVNAQGAIAAANVADLMYRARLRVNDAGHIVHCAALDRRVTPLDVGRNGRLCSPAIDAVVASLARSTVMSCAGLLDEMISPTATCAAAAVLTSPNWHSCETLYIIVPSVNSAQPGVWSPFVSLTLRVHDGTCLPLLMAVGGTKQRTSGVWQGSGPGSIGMLLTNPFARGRSDAAADDPPAAVYLRHVWESLIAGSLAPSIVLVAHGVGSDLALGLLADPQLGAAVQRRVRALALIDPWRHPREFVTAAAPDSPSPSSSSWFTPRKASSSTAASSAAQTLRGFLRERALVWRCEPLVDVRLACSSDELSCGIACATVHIATPPVMRPDDVCHVQTLRLAVTGFVSSHDAASRDVLLSIAAAFLPSAASPQIAVFARLLSSSPSVVAAEYDGGPALAPARSPLSPPSAGSFMGITRAIAACRGEVSAQPLRMPRRTAPVSGPGPGGGHYEPGGVGTPRATHRSATGPVTTSSSPLNPSHTTSPVTPRTPHLDVHVPLPPPSRTTSSSISSAADSPRPRAPLSTSHAEPVSAPSLSTPRAPSAFAADTPRTVRLAGSMDAGAEAAHSTPAFVPPPVLAPPYDRLRDAAVVKMDELHKDAFKPDPELWKAAGVINGVTTYSAIVPVGCDLVGARGDTVLPYSVSAMFQFLVQGGMSVRRELDAQLDTVVDIAEPSPQHSVRRNTTKAVFPTDPRDFILLQWWEVQPDGGGLRMYATSVKDDAVAPEVKGFVRGTMDIGGWVMQPINAQEFARAVASGVGPKGAVWTGSACRIAYMFRTSIGGGIPKMLVRSAIAAQAQQPMLVHKLMQKRIAKVGPFVDAPLCNLGSVAVPIVAAAAAAEAAVTESTEATSETAGSASSEPGQQELLLPPDDSWDLISPRAADATSIVSPSTAAAAVSAGAVSGTSAVPGAVPYTGAPFDLSGSWKLDRSRSDSLQPMLAAMGVGLVWRKLVDAVDIVPTITHTLHRLRMEDSTKYGVSITTYDLDWVSHTFKGADQKEVTYRACVLPGVDSLPPGTAPEAAVAAFISAPSDPPASGSYPRVGAGSGMLLSESVLPDGLGVTWDERHLLDALTLRIVTTYVKGGAVKTRSMRYLTRTGEPPAALLEAPPVTVVLRQASSRAVVAPPSTVVAHTIPVIPRLGLLPQSSPPSLPQSSPPSLPRTSMDSLPDSNVSTTSRQGVGGHGTDPAAPASAATPVNSHRAAHAGPSTAAALGPRQLSFSSSPALPSHHPAAPPVSPALAAASSPDVTARTPRHPPSRPLEPPHTSSSWSAAAWVPDAEARSCGTCHAAFSVLLRIHHCRACGGAFCDAHTTARMPLPHLPAATLQAAKIRPDTVVRVCDGCALPVVEAVVSGVSTQGGTVSVSGGNFGVDASLLQVRAVAVPAVVQGGRSMHVHPGAAVITAPHTRLSFGMPPGVGTWQCTLSAANGRASASFTVAYAAPILVSAESADTEGGLVALRGFNFGDAAALEAGLVHVALNGAPLVIARVVVAHRELQVRIPPGCGEGSCNTLTLTVGGQAAAQALPYSYNRPVIYAIRCVTELAPSAHAIQHHGASTHAPPQTQTGRSVSHFPLESQSLAVVCYLTGACFGADAAALTVHVRGVKCRGVELLLPHTKLRVPLPASLVDEFSHSATAFTASDFVVAVESVVRAGSTPA